MCEKKGERKKIKAGRYNTPSEDDFLNNMSELWLVRNAQLLRWDFPKPEYGVGSAFKQLLEKFGFFNEHFKVLIINSPTITHFGLPAGKGKAIFILSLPFIRSLDLTKVDISLLLLEDFVRLQKKLFVRKLGVNKEFYNHNFYRKGIDKKVVNQAMTDYTRVIFKEGFNFQEQFEVTKTMDRYLKSAPSLWSAYFKLYKKIDRFIKADLLYKDYLKIYPSPELQLQWLSPKKKMI